MMPDMTFHCPKCGSTSFGSSFESGMDGPMTRYCHGGSCTNSRCKFTWLEKDDWKYMTVDGKKLGREAFEAAEKKIRDTPAYGVPMGDFDFNGPKS